jgi:hypothetical protein
MSDRRIEKVEREHVSQQEQQHPEQALARGGAVPVGRALDLRGYGYAALAHV